MTQQAETERIILGIILAPNSRWPDGVQRAKAGGVKMDAFTSFERRTLWGIAEASDSLERAAYLINLAVKKGMIKSGCEKILNYWYWAPAKLDEAIAGLRAHRMQRGLP